MLAVLKFESCLRNKNLFNKFYTHYFRMDNQFNSQEWSLPMSSTMKELEKVCFLFYFGLCLLYFLCFINQILIYFSTTLPVHLLDQCITWVYQFSLCALLLLHRVIIVPLRTRRFKKSTGVKSQTISARRRLPSEEGHSPRRKIEQFAQRFCMLARMLL